jgi:hypothetical protein
MSLGDARTWLGLYFLLSTVITGRFLLLFSGSAVLPLTQEDASASFQILIPVLVGQVTVIFQWIATANHSLQDDTVPCPVPNWAIRLPPLLASSVVVVAALVLAISNSAASNWQASPETFKNAVTFSVTVLNASTIFLVTKLFPSTAARGLAQQGVQPDEPASGGPTS